MKKTIYAAVAFTVFLLPGITYSQADQSKATIPKNASPELRLELEKLLSSDLNQRLEGAFNIGNMGSKAVPAIPILIELLKESKGMVAVDKVSLKYFGDTFVMQASDGRVYMLNPVNDLVSDALGKIGAPAAKALSVVVSQASPNDTVFAFGVIAMAKTQDAAALKTLLSLLKTGDWIARDNIASSLRHSKGTDTIDALIAALKDSDKRVIETAARSLKKITGQDFGMDAAKWEAWRASQKPAQ